MLQMFKIILFLCQVLSIRTQHCLDDNNDPVDSYIIYKMPKIKHTNELIDNGVGYNFLSTKDYYKNWTFSQKSINATNSILANTLRPLYDKNRDKLAYVVYNDQPPLHDSNPQKGHTKGVIIANASGGFWLIHSIPHFPPVDSYSYPSTGLRYGQSCICVSMDPYNLNLVGRQLQYNQPQIYLQNMPPKLRSFWGELADAAQNITVKNPPWFKKAEIRSKYGVRFLSYAKSSEFNQDLYSEFVALDLKTDLLVETWPNGEGRLPSNCSKAFKVYNVEKFSLDNVTFSNTHDHSKWAVAQKDTDWVCIGDINRMEHQKTRGGGTLCISNPYISKKYLKNIKAIENCN